MLCYNTGLLMLAARWNFFACDYHWSIVIMRCIFQFDRELSGILAFSPKGCIR